MNSRFDKNRGERGYVLLVLLLFASLLSIGLLTMMERIELQIKRDREEELIHRGVEYSRAVRRYVKKFGRYPTSLEVLEDPSTGRFLRKRFKDPITGKDFRPLHYGDLENFYSSATPVAASLGTGIASEQAVVLPEGMPPSEAIDAEAIAMNEPSRVAPQPVQTASNPSETATQQPPAETDSATAEGGDGGIAVIGVASYSKSKSIRVFNKKDHYDQWQFVYDPSTDSGLMKGPNQPLLKGTANVQPLEVGQGPTQDSGTSRGQK